MEPRGAHHRARYELTLIIYDTPPFLEVKQIASHLYNSSNRQTV